jgi:alkylation response protein AidB-like acyl-CoA dehydrogenase
MEQAIQQQPRGDETGREFIALSPDTLITRAQTLADELAARPNLGLQTAPKRELERFAELGALIAPLPQHLGGLGLGIEPGTHGTLLRLLAIIGGADLALGRLYEGHVNGLLLVARYGSAAQMASLAKDCHAGLLSGVWNTGVPQLLHIHPHGEAFRYEGVKTFATGAAFVRRPIVTAELPGRGWQMTLPHMDTLGATIDRSFWHPLGMESSESYGIDFTAGIIHQQDLIGAPGDFYRDPMFRGGAIRFAAVQAGAVLRMHAMFATWLDETHRGEDPYQVARLGEVAIAAQEAVLWVERAAEVAEGSFYRQDKEHVQRMIECANMMRTAVERIATRVMQLVTAGVGAHGLLQPQRFERILRDLTMYLRQPAPDQTLANIGRTSLEKSHKLSEGAAGGFWRDSQILESLPPKYFERIYARKHDPWEFETSGYEAQKYEITLANLPRERYRRGVEVGCSIGVLTQHLGQRCDILLGIDVSEKALTKARERCQEMPQIHFRRMQIPSEMPDEAWDLILISEVAYYWTPTDLEQAATELAARHEVGGHLVLVHLTEHVPDYPLTGDQVHEYWCARPEWRVISHQRHPRFRLDVLERLADD